MLKSYVVTTVRHLLEQRVQSAINIIGLAVGLTCFILIGLFVRYEIGYDRQWSQSDRIYRISRDMLATQRITEAHLAGMPAPAAALLKEDFPQIERVARIFCCGALFRAADGRTFPEPGYVDADNELFQIFDFEWISGDPKTALTQPTDIVLTESVARKYFGDRDAMGQTLEYGGGGDGGWMTVKVVGVIRDLPDDTHLAFSMIASALSFYQDEGAARFLNNWNNNLFQTYVLLRPNADIAAVQAQAGAFFERHFEADSSAYTSFTAMPITDIHLRSNRQNELKPPGNLASVYLFSAVALLIIGLACINFMNLATARSAQRVKEIGVRKVLGASRLQLMWQFIGESIGLSLVATVLAVVLVELLLPKFNAFLGRNLTLDFFGNSSAILGLVLLMLSAGVVAGSYPAFYLAAFRPEHVLRGGGVRGTSAATFRKVLVVLQFTISVVLLIVTAAVYEQMKFVRNLELGYDREQVVLVMNNVGGGQWEAMKREWLKDPNVMRVTSSDLPPLQQNPRTAEVLSPGSGGVAGRMQFVSVDYDFFEAYKIDLLAGRAFSREFGTDALIAGEGEAPDRGAFIISELAAQRLGWTPEAAIGKPLEFRNVQGARFPIRNASGTVVGVARNVYFEPLRSLMQPLVYRLPGNSFSAAALRITGRDTPATLAHIDDTWKTFRPALPITRRFLDQDFEALYQAEERQREVFTFFSAIAVFVACLGLFGLALFSAERRTKEIGIRKAVGGSVTNVAMLFMSEFARLVLVASVVAWPIAYLLVQRWLANFAYRIDLGVHLFVGGAIAALIVACATVATVSVRAATVKPVDALRYE